MSASRQLPPSLRRVKKGIVLISVVCIVSWAAAQFEDTLRTETSPLEWLADSSEISPDSASRGGVVQRWLQPMGLILIAGTTIILLYTVRSK